MVRTWLRDNSPSKNILIQDLEFSDEEIRLARIMVESYWAEESPMYSTHLDNRSMYFALMGMCGQLMRMAANRFRRNYLDMQAGGIAVSDQSKHKEYSEAGDRLWAEYANWVARTKVTANMALGWGTT